jgi:high affinity sulfate transporter 1
VTRSRGRPEAASRKTSEPAREAYPGASPFHPARRAPVLHRVAPVTEAVSDYRPATGGRDLLAAVTVAAVAIPSAMGYAEVAGLSPVNGLYALLLPTVAYALLGSSRQLVVGPDGAVSALVGAVVVANTVAGGPEAAKIAGTLALLVAACFVIARVARLAWLADYFSRPVLVGYIHGIAAALVIGQLPKLLGVDVSSQNPLRELVDVVGKLPDTSLATLAVGVGALLILLPLRFGAPRIPGALLLVVGGIALSSAAGLASHGVAVVGDIPSGLPGLGLPGVPDAGIATLAPAAIGMFLVIFADAVLLARSYAGNHRQQVDAGQELLAMGAAQAAAGVSGGFPIAASGSRTAVNDAAGVRTQVAGLLAAGVVVLVLLFLTGPIAHLPKAVLGAIIIAAAIGLVNPGAWRELRRTDNVELALAAVTTAGVLVVGVLPAIAFAVGLSIVDVVRRSARPHDAVLGWVPKLGRYGDVAVYRSAEITPGVVVYRLDDRLFFANAGYVKGRVREAVRGAPPPTHWLVFNAEAVTQVDVAGIAALRELTDDLRHDGVSLAVARLKSAMHERFDEAGLTVLIGPERFYPTVHAAVEACAEAGSSA